MTATRCQYGDERLGGMRSCLLVAWISMTLLGCARTPGHWVGDPGVSQAQMDRDVYDCKRDATRYQPGIGFGGFQTPGTNLFMGGRMPGYYDVDSDIYAECMRVHGYRWVTADQREAERHVAQERQRREKYAHASALCIKYANLSGEYARGPIYTRCMEVEGYKGVSIQQGGDGGVSTTR